MAQPLRALRSMFDAVFHRPQKQAVDGYFETFTAYSPSFSTWQGGIYEAELIRSVIEAGADHASKLRPEVKGTAHGAATSSLAHKPNPWMTTPQFLKRAWTILNVDDTCLIVRVTSPEGRHIGYFPTLPSQCAAYEVDGGLWLQLTFPTGQSELVPWDEVGVLTRHQYDSDLFGDGSTDVLKPTLDLMKAQDVAFHASIENSANVRFIGKFAQLMSPDDMKKRQDEFKQQNLEASNNGGIAVYDQSFIDVEQVKPQSYTINAAQMDRIEKSVFRHFGTSENIVTASYSEQEWNAFYEGRIEPFAVQLGSVLTAMTFSQREIQAGNEITFSSSRLEYASNETKLQVATALYDRGIWTANKVNEIFQEPVFEGGDRHVIRGEYIDYDLISEHTIEGATPAEPTEGEPEDAS